MPLVFPPCVNGVGTDRRRFYRFGLHVGPVVFPFGTLLDPFGEQRDFLRWQGRTLGRHTLFGVGVVDAAQHLAGGHVARHNGGVTRFVGAQRFGAKQQAESARALHAPVAGDALFVEDRANVGVEVDLLFFFGQHEVDRGGQQQQQKNNPVGSEAAQRKGHRSRLIEWAKLNLG